MLISECYHICAECSNIECEYPYSYPGALLQLLVLNPKCGVPSSPHPTSIFRAVGIFPFQTEILCASVLKNDEFSFTPLKRLDHAGCHFT